MTEEEAKLKCDIIRQTAYDLHLYLGIGYLEKVYENALVHRLQLRGLDCRRQVPITVRDTDGFVIGDFIADVIVDGIIIELKCVSQLSRAHYAQLFNYLVATQTEHGLLINFGSEVFQCRKFARMQGLSSIINDRE